jgi:hypothetical protein
MVRLGCMMSAGEYLKYNVIVHLTFLILPFNISAQEQANKSNQSNDTNSPKLNKYDIYMKDYYASTRGPGPEMAYHSFAMQLSSGQRVYGHVRRYFPHHSVAKSRIDVGRRGTRAMVILTRAAGGENFYNSLLKTIEVLSSHRSALSEDLQFQSRPQQAFLHSVYEEHMRLSAAHVSGSRPTSASSTRSLTFQALTVSLKQIELGNNRFQHVDYSNFLIPESLLLPYDPTQVTSSPMLPLLRSLGISNTLRLFSALMCERRIVLVSQSTSRLSACASAATSILAQGLLQWQHIYIPILPPSMMNYLAAPMPYLMGVTANHAPNIERVSGLGEVLVVYLDQNDLKTHNMPRPDLAVPDILTDMDDYQYQQQQQQQQRYSSIADILKLDLVTLMKTDKRLMMVGESSSGPAVAAKSKDLLKRGFGKLKKVAKKQIEKNKIQSASSHGKAKGPDPPGIGEHEDDEEDFKQIYAYTEGFNNQIAEEEARIAFTTFFLSLIGDMRTYLRPPQNGGPPKFDKDLFLESRKKLGDGQNSPLYPMLMHFKESQIFEMFVKARVLDIQSRKHPPQHAAPFSRALVYHNTRRIPFSGPEIRNILAQISSQNPSKNLIQATANIRRRAMALTSNSRAEYLVATEMSKLAQDCRESACFLVEVMSVMWERIRDCKGMQWKHGFYALQIIMELLLHGPLVVIAEAIDGIDKIRKLKFYENMRQLAAQDMRLLAASVYNLLVNRARLFAMRRVCALRRMEAGSSTNRLPKVNRNLRIRMKFNVMHALVKPGSGAVSPAPSGDLLGGGFSAAPESGTSAQQSKSYDNDLLSMSFSAQPPATPASPPVSKKNDLVQMMGNAVISPAASQPISPPQAPHPTFAQILPLPSTANQNLAPSNYIYPSSPSQQQQQTVQNNYKMNPVARQSQHQQPPIAAQQSQLAPAMNTQQPQHQPQYYQQQPIAAQPSQPAMTFQPQSPPKNAQKATISRSQFDPFA